MDKIRVALSRVGDDFNTDTLQQCKRVGIKKVAYLYFHYQVKGHRICSCLDWFIINSTSTINVCEHNLNSFDHYYITAEHHGLKFAYIKIHHRLFDEHNWLS